MILYHLISDAPKAAGQRLLLDEAHPNGVYQRVSAQMELVKAIFACPEAYHGRQLSHEVKVALRELELEQARKQSYPRYPSRLAALYVSSTMEEAQRWAAYFVGLGRSVYGVARIKADGNCFIGDASKCFDGTVEESQNLKMAEIYWRNAPHPDEREPIPEILVDGEILIEDIIPFRA